jgi:hypothetical protein
MLWQEERAVVLETMTTTMVAAAAAAAAAAAVVAVQKGKKPIKILLPIQLLPIQLLPTQLLPTVQHHPPVMPQAMRAPSGTASTYCSPRAQWSWRGCSIVECSCDRRQSRPC